MKSRVLLAAVVAAALVAMLASPPLVRAEDDPAKILPGLEKSLWEGWKNHDAAPFEKHLAEGALNTNAGGFAAGKAKLIADVKSSDCAVASFSLSDIAVHRFGDSTVILTYAASQDATCKGEKLPAKVLSTSVWVKEKGAWRSAAYHESAAPK